MNEKVQKYIDEQIRKEIKKHHEEVYKTLKRLNLGEYEVMPKRANKRDYPDKRIIDGNEKRCRFVPIEITDEEYEELVKHIPPKAPIEPLRSGWYTFAIVITIISAMALFLGLTDARAGVTIVYGSFFLWCIIFYARNYLLVG